MKKILIGIIFSVCTVLSLTACGNSDNVKCTPDLNKAFCMNAQIDYDDFISEAKFQRYGTASWDVEFSSPNTLAGVLLSFEDTNVEASYKGLSFSVPKSALPLKSIISAFIEITDKIAAEPEITGEEDDGFIIVEGKTELGEYELIFDKNCNLSGFEMPNLDLEMKFTECADGITQPSEDNSQPASEAEETVESETAEISEDAQVTE